MLILTIRTDNPEAEIGLFDDQTQLYYEQWHAHRRLAETIHTKIKQLLGERDWHDIEGFVVYQGPGSFTGLRIGLATASALAQGLGVPIVATTGQSWLQQGIQALLDGRNDQVALPEYGAAPHITQQKK